MAAKHKRLAGCGLASTARCVAPRFLALLHMLMLSRAPPPHWHAGMRVLPKEDDKPRARHAAADAAAVDDAWAAAAPRRGHGARRRFLIALSRRTYVDAYTQCRRGFHLRAPRKRRYRRRRCLLLAPPWPFGSSSCRTLLSHAATSASSKRYLLDCLIRASKTSLAVNYGE